VKIGVLKEIHLGEKRVALTPDACEKLLKLGFEVIIEAGAGVSANYTDQSYTEAGATIITDANTVWITADVIVKVRAPQQHPETGVDEVEQLQPGCTLISFIWPAQNEELLKRLQDKNTTVLAMDSVPRLSRAQKLDALSSMANIAGYRAVIEASNKFGRFFAGQITAAGKVTPAKVMVIGAGVAGLAAIGTAKSLGAIVRAFDTRPEVKEQIQSMDAEFLELDFEEDASSTDGYARLMSKEFIEAEMALFAQQAQEVDIIITTALIPGKPAPKLITEDMVKSMREGSVIVDLAAEQGGNCELTQAHKVVKHYGVSIIGYTDLPSRLPTQASQLYATNMYHLLTELTPEKNGEVVIDMDDEVIRGATVVKNGKITWPPPAISVARVPAYSETKMPEVDIAEESDESPSPVMTAIKSLVPVALGSLLLFGLGQVAPPDFMAHFTVFVLSCFIGYMVIWNVSPSLHTPLMSVTNAISSIIVVGALTQIGSSDTTMMVLSAIAILITTMNIVGGFAVTQRMLDMFRE